MEVILALHFMAARLIERCADVQQTTINESNHNQLMNQIKTHQ